MKTIKVTLNDNTLEKHYPIDGVDPEMQEGDTGALLIHYNNNPDKKVVVYSRTSWKKAVIE